MINEFENNKRSLNTMSDLEFTKNQTEMMRYRPNSLSYKLGLTALGFSIFAAFISLNSFNPNNLQVIIKILMNIAILLFGFLFCEKTKAYSKSASIALIVEGGICAARIFWVPLQIMIAFNSFTSLNAELAEKKELLKTETDVDTIDEINDAITGLTASIKDMTDNSPWLGKTITEDASTGYTRVSILPQNGNFRAIFAIVLLIIAACLFISAGVIGIIQSKKLTNYMNSLNQKKKF